jgi:hypothetical protein
MHTPEDGLDHDAGGFKHLPKIIGRGLDEALLADDIESPVAHPPLSQDLGLRLTAGAEFIQNVFPGAFGQRFVGGREVGPCQGQSESGFAGDLVFGADDFLRGLAVARLEAGALAGVGIKEVINGTTFAEPEFLFHGRLEA